MVLEHIEETRCGRESPNQQPYSATLFARLASDVSFPTTQLNPQTFFESIPFIRRSPCFRGALKIKNAEAPGFQAGRRDLRVPNPGVGFGFDQPDLVSLLLEADEQACFAAPAEPLPFAMPKG